MKISQKILAATAALAVSGGILFTAAPASAIADCLGVTSLDDGARVRVSGVNCNNDKYVKIIWINGPDVSCYRIPAGSSLTWSRPYVWSVFGGVTDCA